MSWKREAPTKAGWYWYRASPYSGYRIIHFCWPGRVKVLTDPYALPGTPSTALELFEADPHGSIHFPALEAPRGQNESSTGTNEEKK